MNNAKNSQLTNKEIEDMIADSDKWEDGTFGTDERFVAVSPRCLKPITKDQEDEIQR